MARPISVILDDIIVCVRELKDAVLPFTRLASASKGGDGPFPVRRAATMSGRRPGRPRGSSATAKASRAATKPPVAVERARKPSPARQAQGRYMSAIRTLSRAEKAAVKKVRAVKGVEAAITLALGMTTKRA